MYIPIEIADKYQGLFNLMSKVHNLTLTISEMDEIIIEAQKVVNKISSKLSCPNCCSNNLNKHLSNFNTCYNCGYRWAN